MSGEPTERPIIFSRPMIKALLAGTKTQTRRVVTPAPIDHQAIGQGVEWHGGRKLLLLGYGAPYVHTDRESAERAMENCARYEIGDTLWVRETWRVDGELDDVRAKVQDAMPDRTHGPFYRETRSEEEARYETWRPSIFMPRWAARIFLRVNDVRVERLQQITEADAMAEGWSPATKRPPVEWYRQLWDDINAERGYRWLSNPWVWVITFERVKPS